MGDVRLQHDRETALRQVRALHDALRALVEARDELLRAMEAESAALFGKILATSPAADDSERQWGIEASSLLDLSSEEQLNRANTILTAQGPWLASNPIGRPGFRSKLQSNG